MQGDERGTNSVPGRRRAPPPPGTWNNMKAKDETLSPPLPASSTAAPASASLSPRPRAASNGRRPPPPPPVQDPALPPPAIPRNVADDSQALRDALKVALQPPNKELSPRGTGPETDDSNDVALGKEAFANRRALFEQTSEKEASDHSLNSVKLESAPNAKQPSAQHNGSPNMVRVPSLRDVPLPPRRKAPTLPQAAQLSTCVSNPFDDDALHASQDTEKLQRDMVSVAEALVDRGAQAVTIPAVEKRSLPILHKEEPEIPTAVPPPPPPIRRSATGAEVVKLVLWDFDGSTTPGGLSVRAGDKVTTTTLASPEEHRNNPWTFVAHFKRSGLVPTSYLGDVPVVDIEQARIAADRLPPRPGVLEYGKENGFARDLIAIRSRDGERGPITKPVVRFYGPSSKPIHAGDRVQVFIEGRVCCELRIGEGGRVLHTITGESWDLANLAPSALKNKNIQSLHVRFEHIVPYSSPPARWAECTLFIWDWDDCVVVSDVDGTITLSDVGGHLNTTLFIKAGYAPNAYAHPGVCTLFSHIAQECFPCRFVYLTARPLDLCVETRTYLRGLRQDGKTLPLGPCVTDSTSYYGSLRREVIEKSSHVFKATFLVEDLRRCFEAAGRDVIERPVFMAGFGNKDTDAAAYRLAGVHPVLTFVIDSRSVVTAGAGYAAELVSYEDPQLLNWVTDMSRLFMAGKLPSPPS